jgi:hypothetical protein
MKLSSNHHKTLLAVFENPVGSDVAWSDIEKLFLALGAEVKELEQAFRTSIDDYLDFCKERVEEPDQTLFWKTYGALKS